MSAKLGAYVVDYRCDTSECAPVFSWHCRAYSVEHAREKFWESDAHAVPWAIVCVRRLRPRTARYAEVAS